MSEPRTIELSSWRQVRDALRSKQLRQDGYGEGAVVMAGTLLDLHGAEHRERRRIENRLFRRATFAHWEHEVLGSMIEATLQPFVERGSADLVQIGYRAAMNLTAQIAGIDIDAADEARTDQLYAIVKKFSEGATLMHSTRDKDQVRAEVTAAAAEFRAEFFAPSLARRTALVAGASTDLPEDVLPQDVLTTLLRHRAQLPLDAEVVFREICFYLQAGAHSTANAFTHTVDELLQWTSAHHVSADSVHLAFVQRCVHESLRLNPASPVAYRTPLQAVTLSDGTVLRTGDRVVLDLTAANRDLEIFGDRAGAFDPYRVVPDGVPRWGMSFGAGMHACIGAGLDGGLAIDAAGTNARSAAVEPLYGTVAVIAHRFLAAGGRGDPASEPTFDANSTRKHHSSYPVVFYDSHLRQERADG